MLLENDGGITLQDRYPYCQLKPYMPGMGEPSEGADPQEETNSESSVGSGVPCIDLTDFILETNNHIMTDGNKLQSVSLAGDSNSVSPTDPSTFVSLAGDSNSVSPTDPSTFVSLAGDSNSVSPTDPSTFVSLAGDSNSVSPTDPSTFVSLAGDSNSVSDPSKFVFLAGDPNFADQKNCVSLTGDPNSDSRKRKADSPDVVFIKRKSAKPRNAEVKSVEKQSCVLTDKRRINSMILLISSEALLTDEEINHAQAILKKQHPDIDGFQDMAIFEDNGCHFVGTPSRPFVQILHAFSNHWICVSNVGCRDGQIKIYDSLWTGRLTPKLQKQVAWMLFTKEDEITAEWPDMQKQQGGSDCGLFAIAVATALCQGQDPVTCSWNQNMMRRHLVSCMLLTNINSFPSIGLIRKSVVPSKVLHIKVYCHCRQPQVDRRQLVQCSSCSELFHRSCETIPRRKAGEQQKTTYLCQGCRAQTLC